MTCRRHFENTFNHMKEILFLQNVADMFDNLADAVDIINSVFSKQVQIQKFQFIFCKFLFQMNSVIFSSVILEIIGAQLLLLNSFYNFPLGVYSGVKLIIWVGSFLMLKFMTIYASSLCSNEAKELNVLVDRQLNTCSHDPALLKLGALSSKMQFRQIAFNTGLFNIAWTIILPIFSTITTYIIIITQFMT